VWRSNSAMLTACSGGAASWRFPRQLEKDLGEQKAIFNRLEHPQSLLSRAGREGSRMGL
jgi:hypothetical protein